MHYCPLCSNDELTEIKPDNDKRNYYQCQQCFLIFADRKHHLSPKDEKHRYAQHNNGIDQPGYVNFLSQVIDPALNYINNDMVGCDYGCGPVPTLSKLVEREGIRCHDYDPLFEFNPPLEKYDFIFSTECFEHFFNPKEDFVNIDSLLKVEGYLMIMTLQYKSPDQFQDWFYKKDYTHVSFYHKNTFKYICIKYNYKMVLNDYNRVVILQKK
jgi:hypothetical protein